MLFTQFDVSSLLRSQMAIVRNVVEKGLVRYALDFVLSADARCLQ